MERQRGFTFLWLIFVLAVAAAGLAAIAQPASLAVRRDREAELIFRGTEIAHALTSYWAATPGDAKQLPVALDELLDDRRSGRSRRHLRRVYADPFTGLPDWVLVTTDDGRIAGVHSRSDMPALRVADLGPSADGAPVPVSARVFRYSPVLAPPPAASAAASAAAPDKADSSPYGLPSAPTP
jgi:type II secretory pathway pseudopilin PulG